MSSWANLNGESMIDDLVRILEQRDVEWEVYWETGRGSSFKIERGNLERAQRKYHSGIGLRIGYKNRQGFSYITGLNHSRRTLEEFVDRTIKLAKISEVPFLGFANGGRIKRVKGIYDKRIEEMEFEDALECAKLFLEKEVELKEKIGNEYTLSGALAFGHSVDGITNSNDIRMEEASTGGSLNIYIIKRKGIKNGSGSYCKSFRMLPELYEVFDEGLKRALKDAELSFRAKKMNTFEGELILDPRVVSSLIRILMGNMYADNVYHKHSRFTSPGEKIASDSFTLIDDATIEKGIRSYSFDGEGNPSRRTPLIERGILKNFLFDEYYARLMGMESTGNAVRDFRTTPHIGSSNLIVEGKRENLEELDGIIVKKVFGEHTANPVSGDFSLSVELGYAMEKGEIKPFKDNMLVGNIFELIKSINALGKESEDIGGFISPEVLTFGKII
ncbi:TldD/PmbA family protein [Palaeococcus sp. (in: euryarchaeotes)]